MPSRPAANYPNYRYAHGHVGVHAEFVDVAAFGAATKALSRLHPPIARVALELVLGRVISEWVVSPKTDAWPGILDDSLAVGGFEERRTGP